ncbi:hypothetical protein ABPG74_018128 [Tetrahymena malaccensis]
MAEGNNKGKYSDIKGFFKNLNKANEKDLQDLIKIKQESKTFEFSKKAKSKDNPQTQPQQQKPQQNDTNSQPEQNIFNRMASIFQNNNQLDNPQPGNKQPILNTNKRPHSSQSLNLPQRLDSVDSDLEEKEQDQEIFKQGAIQQDNIQSQPNQQVIPQAQPILTQENDNKIENININNDDDNKNNISNNYRNNYNNNNNNYNNNNNFKMDNPQPSPPTVNEDLSNMVKYEGPQFIKILQFNEFVIFIDETSVYKQTYSAFTEKDKGYQLFQQEIQELSMERLKKIYSLPESNKKIYKIINATAHESILCLQIHEQEQNSQNDEDSGYGFVFLNFIYDENEQIQSIKAQMIKQVDKQPIKCFQLDQEKEIFFYSVEAGFLFCFGFDLSYKFCYQVPDDQHITNFFYDNSNQEEDILIFSTNKGAIYKLAFRFTPQFEVIQEQRLSELIDAQIISYLGLSFDRQHMLVLHTKYAKSEATVYLYPSFKKQQNFETISSNQYIQLYDFVISFTQTNLNYEFFGLLQGNQIAIYCYDLEENSNKLKQNLVYQKQIGYSPKCMYFSLDGFASKLIRIYYNNPDKLKQETQQETCRLILDLLDSKFK